MINTGKNSSSEINLIHYKYIYAKVNYSSYSNHEPIKTILS